MTKDKALHFSVSFILAVVAYFIIGNVLLAAGVAFAVGVAKEVSDIFKKDQANKETLLDLAFDASGILLFMLLAMGVFGAQ